MTNEQVELTEIDHITINVHNLEQALNWYQTSFSCKLEYQTKTLAILNFKNIKIVLSLPSDQRPHVAYLKQNASEYGEITKQSDNCHSTFISDPSGNPIELVKRNHV